MTTSTLELNLNNLSNNICLYYTLLVDDIYQHLMDKALAAGHLGLKLSHALILPQISSEGTRIVDIAKSQGVSKQAIGQIANELEQLGYITRTDDANDKRSKKLILTEQGIQLIRQAASFMTDVDRELKNSLGAQAFNTIKTLSHQLFKSMSLKYPDAGAYTPEISSELPLIVYATSLATQLDLMLQAENTAKGHAPLKRSYWQVLEKITQQGVRINDLAELNGISKQAISQLANEIEKAGYITRVDDPVDKRAKKLLLTGKGEELILDTLASTAQVEQQLAEKIGSPALKALKHALQQHLHQPQASIHKSVPQSTEQKLHRLLQQFIDDLDGDEKRAWLDKADSGYTLNSFALEHLRKLHLQI